MKSCIHNHTRPRRSAGRFPGVSLTLFVGAIIVFAFPQLTGWLQYDQAAVLAGELWRVATCQWTHWNFSHVLWDALMLLALGALCERICRTTFLACTAASAVLIPLTCALALPHMHHYRGLSGVDSALFVLLAVQLIRINWSQDRAVAAAAALGLAGFALKCAYEYVTGHIIFVEPDAMFVPIPLAHVAGGAIGLVVALSRTASNAATMVNLPLQAAAH